MEQKNYQDNNSYLDEWKFSLLFWNSDEDEAGYWREVPSYYSKKIDTSNTFYFDSGVNSAIDQWDNALSMDFEYETESEADIKIYGASKSFLINNMGADFGDFGVGLTQNDIKHLKFIYTCFR